MTRKEIRQWAKETVSHILHPHKKDYVARMEEEYDQLNERTNKLEAFTKGQIFLTLSSNQRTWMEEQLIAMKKYRAILLKRLQLEGGGKACK